MQGRSLFMPRANPLESSLLSIMKPNARGDVDPGIATSLYMKPPCYQAPGPVDPTRRDRTLRAAARRRKTPGHGVTR